MLLELGKMYGYETSAAINDAKKKFMNIPLEEVATLKNFKGQRTRLFVILQRYKRDLQGKDV